jgi:hypothetical protein
MKRFGLFACTVVVAGLAAVGCSSSGSGTGELAVKLTDAPGPYDQVNVNVVEIAARRVGVDDGPNGDGGWVRIAIPRTSVDLLTLQNGVELPLGAATLPAGSYDMIRLVVEDSNVVVAGTSLPLKVPSGSTRGVQLKHSFVVVEDGHTELLIDFDAQASVHQEGNGDYIMNPVLSVKRETH